MTEPIRIYVGTDRSQMAGFDVLKYSIERHTDAKVEMSTMMDVHLPDPVDPRNRKRTGFSFNRFAIPQLAGYKGRAIYTDADMQVFTDIRELWELDFHGAKVVCQEELPDDMAHDKKKHAPKARKKQCSVMLLDCGALDWDPVEIVRGLDGKYTYQELMSEMCILDESEVSYTLPIEWNSLEHYDENTCLIHYTDMPTQPWVSAENPLGWVWINEVRRMLKDKVIGMDYLHNEVALGYARPSLVTEIKKVKDSRDVDEDLRRQLINEDRKKGFVKHAAVMEAKRQYKKEIKHFLQTHPDAQGDSAAKLELDGLVSGLKGAVKKLWTGDAAQ